MLRRLSAIGVVALVALSTLGTLPASGIDGRDLPIQISGDPSAPMTFALFSDPNQKRNTLRDFERGLVTSTLPFPFTKYEQGTIRASLYHLTDTELALNLVTAAENGVKVQVLLDGSNRTLGCPDTAGCVNPAYQILKGLNTLGSAGTWLRTCGTTASKIGGAVTDGCVGAARNHNKFILVKRSPRFEWEAVSNGQHSILSHDVVVQTSSNNTDAGYHAAYNNALVTINQPSVYADYVHYFQRVARPKPSTPGSILRFTRRFGFVPDTTDIGDHDIATWSFPRSGGSDPIAQSLAAVRWQNGCANPRLTSSSPSRTSIAVAMSRITGRTLAVRELAGLHEAGCPVAVAYSYMDHRDHRILSAAGVSLHRVCVADTRKPNAPNQYLHSKYLLIAGTVGGLGLDVRAVFTGSDNLSDQALTRTDDRLLRYVEPSSFDSIFNDYQLNFLDVVRASYSTSASLHCSGEE